MGKQTGARDTMKWRPILVLLLLLSGCSSSPSPTLPPGLLEACGESVPAPRAPKTPYSPGQLQTAFNGVQLARESDKATLKECATRHAMLVAWLRANLK